MLPDWPTGAVTILSTGPGAPHAIPVSAALRAGPRRALIALASGRESLARLRVEPRVSLTVLAAGVAVTAYGRARVVQERLIEGVAAIAIDVDDVQHHERPTLQIEAGVRWRWRDPRAAARDREVVAALQTLKLHENATFAPAAQPKETSP